jgi:uncharacterized protein YjeT (DUF2065 family)
MDGETLISLAGLLLMVEGLPWAAAPGRYKAALLTLLDVPNDRLRWLGLGAMASGLLLVYLAGSR